MSVNSCTYGEDIWFDSFYLAGDGIQSKLQLESLENPIVSCILLPACVIQFDSFYSAGIGTPVQAI